LFKSEVTLLKNENRRQLETLQDHDQIVINNIMKSMSIFRVNSFDAQVVHRDLIGMAQEFELRGSSFEQSIGKDIKEFTIEIINNSLMPSKIEILLKFLIKFSSMFLLSFLVLSLGAFSSLTWDANIIIFLLYIGTTIVAFITDEIITPLYSVEKSFKQYIPSIFSIALYLILITIVVLLNDRESTVRIHAVYVIMISGLAYVFFSYLNIKNINKLSEGKKNHIADLIGK